MYLNFVFDVDGTLIDSENVIISTLSKVVEKYGIKKENKELSFVLGIPGVEALRLLGIKNIKQAKEEWDFYLRHESKSLVLFNGIRNMLDALYNKDITMGIVTSRTRNALDKLFDNLDLKKYFKYTVCVDDTLNHKPQPAPLLKYLELSGADPSSVIYIGDTLYDSLCAINAEIDFGLASWGAKTITDINAEYIFKQPQDIFDLNF